MDASFIFTVIGIIILLAAVGLLKPIRNFATGLGSDVDALNDVKTRLVDEWDTESAVNHAKKMTKLYNKAKDIGPVKTKGDVMKLIKAKSPSVDTEE